MASEYSYMHCSHLLLTNNLFYVVKNNSFSFKQ